MSSGCGDVLSLADLQTAKKHQLFEAEVITGKQGGIAGGADIDYATNQVTGQTQKTLPAVLRDAGFRPAAFTFDTGGTLGTNDADVAVLWPGPSGDGQYYVWHGALPKVIPASSTPASSGGISETTWVPFGDLTLRGDLASTAGASLVNAADGDTVQVHLDAAFSVNDPRYYGARTSASDNSAAISACAAASPAGIKIAGGVLKTSALTINVPVSIEAGSGFEVQNSTLLTLNSAVNAGNHQIFFGSGSVAIPENGTTASAYWFGASGVQATTTATTAAASNIITTTSVIPVKNGNQIVIEHGGAPTTLTPPNTVTVASTGLNRQGPAGATTYAYRVSAVDDTGGVSAASAAVTITNGNSTLGTVTPSIRGLAFNVVRWDSSIPRAAVWRSKAGGAYELLGVFGMGQSDSIANGIMDAGLPAVSLPWVPAAPPASGLNQRLTAYVSSGAGTTSLTLSANAQVTASGLHLRADDTIALTKLFNSVTNVHLPPAAFNVTKLSVPQSLRSIQGTGDAELVGFGTLDAVITASGVVEGFSISGITVSPLAWHNQMGIQLDQAVRASVANVTASGNLALFMSNCTGCILQNNTILNWIDDAIFDYIGNSNVVRNNYINAGCAAIPQNAAAVQGYNVTSCTYSGNKAFGNSVYSIKIEQATQCLIYSNQAFNTWAESYHMAGSCSGNRIHGNTMFGGSLMMDYAISISNDDRPNAVIYGNEVSNNYIYQCGTAAIAVCEFGGVSPSIRYTIIKGNTVFGANSNQQPDMPEIYIEGSGVTNTYISDHHSFSYPNVTHIVKEVNTTYGLPSHTQVGTLFGDGGSVALVSLTGTGSSKLAGGGTGL